MKKILILGAGLVSRPMVRYLLDVPDFEVVVASRTVSKAQELVGSHPRGKAVALNVENDADLDKQVAGADLAVSLLPYTFHVKVAGLCLKYKKPLVTTSYVSDAMRALDAQARAAGVIFLNEMGLDPGIDHMSAMKIIHGVQKAGGKVASFMSYCGGLPAPEANDNPLGYKFSWSPKGVVMAGRNDARYLKDGKEVFIPGPELFGNRWPLKVAEGYEFEAYANRNSLPYIETYGLAGVRTMLRGTLRNPGWCETLKAIADLGVLKDDSVKTGIAGLTPAAWLRGYVPARAGASGLRADVAAKLGLKPDHPILERFAWLGLFDEKPIGLDAGSNLDILAKQMLDRMAYKPAERDMIVLHHEFIAEMPQAERIYSTLIAFGEPNGDSSMARTVSLPAAIGVRMILHGELKLTGVQIPVLPEIYGPVLSELARLGIECKERKAPVS
ncbi:MAG TPA: saccharopine dehydrogenase C-terminal domain-containing protein [bacterium]|nr:saccharopine dehydrogenase C-terminal domain-containing protein [bacterium]